MRNRKRGLYRNLVVGLIAFMVVAGKLKEAGAKLSNCRWQSVRFQKQCTKLKEGFGGHVNYCHCGQATSAATMCKASIYCRRLYARKRVDSPTSWKLR